MGDLKHWRANHVQLSSNFGLFLASDLRQSGNGRGKPDSSASGGDTRLAYDEVQCMSCPSSNYEVPSSS